MGSKRGRNIELQNTSVNFHVVQVIRSQLHISRDMPFTKVVRSAEEDAKGVKPVTVTFEKSTVSTRTRMMWMMDDVSGQECCVTESQNVERKQYINK